MRARPFCFSVGNILGKRELRKTSCFREKRANYSAEITNEKVFVVAAVSGGRGKYLTNARMQEKFPPFQNKIELELLGQDINEKTSL